MPFDYQQKTRHNCLTVLKIKTKNAIPQIVYFYQSQSHLLFSVECYKIFGTDRAINSALPIPKMCVAFINVFQLKK